MYEALPAAVPVSAQLPAAEVLAALLTASLTGVIIFRPVYAGGNEDGEIIDLAYVHLNPAAQQMLRQPACPAKTFLALFPATLETGVFAFYRDTFLADALGHLNVNYQHEGLDNFFKVAALRTGDLLVVSFTDTSDHDRSAVEAALRASQTREQGARAQAEAQRAELQALLQQAPVAIAVFEGPDQRITAANPRMCAIWDRTPQQALGRPLLEVLPELRGQGFDDLIAQAMATGQPVGGAEAPATLWRDGQLQTTYYNFVFQPFHDEQNRVQGVIEVASEVTEQVRTRQLLEEQARELAQLNQELEARVLERTQALRQAQVAAEATAQRLLHVTESLPSTSFTVDQSGQVLYISPQWYAYTGMVPGTDITAAWPQAIHPDDLPLVAEQYGAALAGGGSWSYEFRLRGADGHYRWFANRGAPEPLAAAEAAGRPRQWFGSNLDIDDLKRAQRQLEEKDEFLTSVLSSIPASVVTFEGEDLRYGFFNEAFQRRTQGRAVPGLPAGEAFPEAEAQGFLALLRRVLRTGEPYQAQEVYAHTRDAHTGQPWEMYLDLAYLPLRHGQQLPHAVLGFTVDVTDRVVARRQAEAAQAQALAAAEQAAAQREAFYQVFEQTPAIIGLLREPDHRFEYANDAYQQLFPDRQLVGRSVAEAVPEAVEHGFVALLDRVYRTGETYFGQEMLLPVTRTEGQPPQDLYFDFTYQALREAGHIVGISIFATDVTERVRARCQREAQQAQLHDLFMQAPAPVAILDGPDLTYQLVNPAYQRVFAGRELLGHPLVVAMPELAGTDLLVQLNQVYQTGETYLAQELPILFARHTNGPLEERYFTFTYQARRDERGAVDGALIFGYEVTDQVVARQQLAQTNDQLTAANRQLTRINTDLDNFVYTASHDLKQPIANIEGLLTVLHEELARPAAEATTGPLLDLMQRSVERFKRTISQLTDIAKLQAAYDDQPTAEVDLAALVADICQDLRPEFQAIGAGLTVDVAECPTLAFAEKNLRSLVYNLLSNALKYRHPDRVPQLGLRCRPAGEFAVLEVQDNGLGLSPTQQKKLFGLFQRLHVHVEGSGVGLYMVKKIIENAGGRIEVDSQQGVGSTFRLYFPRPL